MNLKLWMGNTLSLSMVKMTILNISSSLFISFPYYCKCHPVSLPCLMPIPLKLIDVPTNYVTSLPKNQMFTGYNLNPVTVFKTFHDLVSASLESRFLDTPLPPTQPHLSCPAILNCDPLSCSVSSLCTCYTLYLEHW